MELKFKEEKGKNEPLQPRYLSVIDNSGEFFI
jgi:hypothetical protein